jgi:hypothetical protein
VVAVMATATSAMAATLINRRNVVMVPMGGSSSELPPNPRHPQSRGDEDRATPPGVKRRPR